MDDRVTPARIATSSTEARPGEWRSFEGGASGWQSTRARLAHGVSTAVSAAIVAHEMDGRPVTASATTLIS